ncbi:hypothetical protein N7475_009813 [Penicillium sp. IBT 31633x]|nr:hypothetical protein N7475_009813 [Penicillium sp. IBT 31633x]
MDQPSNKRRRTDAAAALSKPFKSPLRRPAPTNITDISSTPIPSKTPQDSKISVTSAVNLESHPIPDSPGITMTPVPAKGKRTLCFSVPKEPSDPQILELQKQQRGLQSQVDTLRTKLELATQALNLESSTKDTELHSLITKWRLVSQDAADEVFASAKEKVSRMGGMKAWKERSKRDAIRWDFDEEKHGREHLDEEFREIDSSYIEDPPENLQNKEHGTEEVVGESPDEVTIVILL